MPSTAPPVISPGPYRLPLTSRAGHVWGETWRLLLASLFGIATFAFLVSAAPDTVPPHVAALVFLDLALGLPAIVLLLWRRRAPLATAAILTLLTSVSGTAGTAAAIAVVSMATRHRWRDVWLVGAAWMASSTVFGLVRPEFTADATTWETGRVDGWYLDALLNAFGYAVLVLIGWSIGLRRALVRSLADRAETAEREQASRLAQARSGERARIAREMHDVLAHRISLVAMHAGALAYRKDLPPERVAEAAAVIQDAAHTALQELRDVLGVLRDLDGVPGPDADGNAHPEPPQPTLADLPLLLEDVRAAGVTVTVEDTTGDRAGLSQPVSRSVFRILQEALTNARKHATWTPVEVTLAGAPGDGLTLTVRNPLPVGSLVGSGIASSTAPAGAAGAAGDHDPRRDAPVLPSSGLGLVGITERAVLSGGRLSHGVVDGDFVIEAWLPWAS